MRINKYIASGSKYSRRKADELIRSGMVKVNGKVLRELGYNVTEEDEVLVSGEPIRQKSEKKVYYLMNKPIGIISSVKDDKGRPTVIDLMSDVEERIFPVGRLDYNTSGLIIITNDGDLANKIMHPSNHIEKTYRVRVAGIIPKSKLAKLRQGVDIGGFVTSKAQVKVVTWNRRSMIIELTIHEGKNRQVRKMFSAIGYPVQELCRISIGNISLGHIKPGQYRKLSRGELEYLMKE